MRATRIVIFGALIGLFNTSPMLCTATIFTILLISSLLYFLVRPYPDNVQNILLGASDVSSCLCLLFLSIIYFITKSNKESPSDNSLSYLTSKWRLGWVSIIFVIIGAFLLIAELLVSIVKGNSTPLNLTAEDAK